MKKMGIAAALLTLLLCACGGQAAETASGEAGHAWDTALMVQGTRVNGETSVADLLALLGGDYEYAEAISCVYDGMDKTYTYPDAVVYTYPAEDGECLMELYCTGGEVETALGGVTFGAAREEVIAAFGQNFTESGSVLRYENDTAQSEDYEPDAVYFELTDGKVTAIATVAEHRAE
ncbi:MAG: hypothetical protein HFF17_02445 [Oscillospiraceae bacterium]|nr:hypothetical protein [Oscillospiraceae bacterium]